MAEKPKGSLGPNQVKIVSGDAEASFDKIPFPKGKDETEEFIVSRFLASADKAFRASTSHPFFISNPRKNQENDFDFDVDTPIGPAYLELMEVAPMENVKGGYENAPASYNPYELAEFITGKIMSKSGRYPKNLKRELFLLLYTTHWAFVPSNSTFVVLRSLLLKAKPSFNFIFFFQLFDAQEGEVTYVYPVESASTQDPEVFRDNGVWNSDPAKCVLVKSKP